MNHPLIVTPQQYARELLQKAPQALREKYGESLRQVFSVTEYDTPHPLGSGVLIRFGSYHFLVSAAHVLDHLRSSTLYIGGNVGLVEVRGTASSTISPTGVRADDTIDIGYVKLDESAVDELGSVSFLGPDDLDPNDAPGPTNLYIGLGFPAKSSKKDLNQKIVRSRMISVTGSVNETMYAELGLQEESHILINYDRENMVRDGVKQAAPKPEGMSGGGLWRFDATNLRPSRIGKLVGILTEYRDRKRYMLATRISVVIESIRNEYPELRDVIPEVRRLRVNFQSPPR
jgi:hypothetical protein